MKDLLILGIIYFGIASYGDFRGGDWGNFLLNIGLVILIGSLLRIQIRKAL